MYDIIDFDEINENSILIDVRTREEYNDFHIPGALSMPILNFEERKIVGTLYDNGEKDLAKAKALEFGSRKLKEFLDLIIEQNDKKIVFYCARGGFRSKTVAALFFSLGYNVCQLKGGIKHYRQIVNANLPDLIKDINLIALYGPTGSGKSKILNILKEDYPVIDLEALANHKGSVLGSIGMGQAHSQKTFEALVFEQLRHSTNKNFLIEGESKRIGNIVLPQDLWDKMLVAKKIYIESPIEYRVDRLIFEYVNQSADSELLSALSNIEKYISKENYEAVVNSIKSKEYKLAAKILCEKYYDHNYKFRPDANTIVIENKNDAECANEILKLINM